MQVSRCHKKSSFGLYCATEADTPTIRLGATPSGLISDPPPSPSPIFMPDALPDTTLSLYSGLEQAPNMLACIPSGVVNYSL